MAIRNGVTGDKLIEIRATDSFKEFERDLSNMARDQIPFALMFALNETAKGTLAANRKYMQRVFDRPTRWTLNAFFFKRARKSDLVATIQRKRKNATQHYLEVQSKGGKRPKTGLEKSLQRNLAYAGHFETVVPAPGARLNKHGNIAPGHLRQIISAIKASGDPYQNETKTSGERKRKSGAARYFVPKPESRLTPGVWQRKGKSITPVLYLTDAHAHYKPVFHFEKAAAQASAGLFPVEFNKSFRRAIATAR